MANKLHAILVPFPGQGHITPLFQLALKLLQEEEGTGFTTISFVNTEYDHELILANGNCKHLLQVPGLRLFTIPDGLPPTHGRFNDPNFAQFTQAMDDIHPSLQILIQGIVDAAAASQSCPPVTCIIADIFFYWMADVAAAVHVPWVAFWTTPPHANLVYSHTSDLFAEGIVPVNCKRDQKERICQDLMSTQRIVDCVPGLQPLQASELPSVLQPPDGSPLDFFFQWCLARFGSGVPQRASLHICNTVYELDKEAADAFQECVGIHLPMGPFLPQEFFSHGSEKIPTMETSLWAQDHNGCKEWLDKQEHRSVLYISFGSIVHIATQQMEEIAAGLEGSGRPFLWVQRSEVEAAMLAKLEALKKRSGGRGMIVSWAPQWLVLSHPSVAAFLTHCGWNSILEGISAGLPLLAWPGGFAEQNMNASYILRVWKNGIGFTFELSHDNFLLVRRQEIERVIRCVFGSSKDAQALRERAFQLQKIVTNALMSPYGSSQTSLQRFLAAIVQLQATTSHPLGVSYI